MVGMRPGYGVAMMGNWRACESTCLAKAAKLELTP
jgi:hypothetical protein